MDRGQIFFNCMILFAIFRIATSNVYNASLAKSFSSNDQLFFVIPGIKMSYNHGDLSIQVSFREFFSGK